MPNQDGVLSFSIDNLVHIYAQTHVQAVCSVVILLDDSPMIMIPTLQIDRLGNPIIPRVAHPETGEPIPLFSFKDPADSDGFALAVNRAYFKGRES
jgi:hypothetical protein